MGIQGRLILALVGTAGIAAVLVSSIAYMSARDALTNAQFEKLTTIREHKASQIEHYLHTIREQVENMADNPSVVDAMHDFSREWSVLEGSVGDNSLEKGAVTAYYSSGLLTRLPKGEASAPDHYLPGSRAGLRLHSLYLANNPHELGQKHKLDAAEDGSGYSAAHADHHPFFRDFLDRFGYYDIFLIEPETGNIVYTVYKEVDFATSLRSGPYKDTNFAEVFRTASSLEKGGSFMVDFEPYAPSYGAPASFIGSPIYDNGKRIGVLVFQLPLDRINNVMTSNGHWEASGLGETGEAYLVGPDSKLRTESRFFLESPEAFISAVRDVGISEDSIASMERLGTTVGLLGIETDGVTAALKGKSGTDTFNDYRGSPVLSSYRPIEIEDLDWVILSEIDGAEAYASVRAFRNHAFLGTLIVLMGSLTMAYFFGRAIARPITEASDRIRALALGESTDKRLEVRGSDETAHLAAAYNALADGMADLTARADRVARGEISDTPTAAASDEAATVATRGALAESFHALEEAQRKLTVQATLIADGKLSDDRLRERIQGRLGDAFSDMSANLQLIARQAQAIADGDLVDDSLKSESKGELGRSFQRMVVSLRTLVTEVQATSVALNATAAQVQESAGSQQLGASEQAAAVEETRRILSNLSSSAEEIAAATAAVYTNAEVTQQTSQQTADAIQEFSAHTARIGEIASFIKDIANKSDLLALNAALEGTKAGEAGRGFSLVATQMQRLAEQVMGSVKDIDSLTEDIRKATTSTVMAVGETAKLSAQTTHSAGSISEAIQEQKVGTQQSSIAMDQIASVARQSVTSSADLVEASSQLISLSNRFQELISTYSTETPAPRSASRARNGSHKAA